MSDSHFEPTDGPDAELNQMHIIWARDRHAPPRVSRAPRRDVHPGSVDYFRAALVQRALELERRGDREELVRCQKVIYMVDHTYDRLARHLAQCRLDEYADALVTGEYPWL